MRCFVIQWDDDVTRWLKSSKANQTEVKSLKTEGLGYWEGEVPIEGKMS